MIEIALYVRTYFWVYYISSMLPTTRLYHFGKRRKFGKRNIPKICEYLHIYYLRKCMFIQLLANLAKFVCHCCRKTNILENPTVLICNRINLLSQSYTMNRLIKLCIFMLVIKILSSTKRYYCIEYPKIYRKSGSATTNLWDTWTRIFDSTSLAITNFGLLFFCH